MAINNLITFRKGVATEWSSQNPTLASGEPGYDGTNNVLKIGDGDTAWNDLDPIALSSVNEDGSPILGGELNLDNNDLVIDCRNETGSTIAAGTPVYVSGYYSANGKPLIAPADANNTSKMPAFGILNTALDTDTEGTMGVMGVVSHINTSSFGIGDVIYVASGGGLTNTKPILENNLIQNLGRVLRVDASQGRILLLGAGRTNDVPNLDEGKIWVGSSSNTITSSTIHIDETNNRVGIGTASPSAQLDVNGAIKTSSYIQFATTNGYIGGQTADTLTYQADSHRFWNEAKTDEYATFNTSSVVFNDGGLNRDFRVEGDGDQNLLFTDANTDRLGIGTASPSYKLEVNGDIGLTDSGFYASPTGVMVGTSGWLYNDGQTTLSHGNFSDNGDAQNSSYVLRTSTTNDTFTTIQNNASNVILASNRTMMFTANIVARRTNGQDNAAYKIEGVLFNDGYGASILGTPVKTILYESDSSWDVQAILSGGGYGASDYLLIQGKGAASKNVNWVCKLDLLEVGGDISGYTEANILNINNDIVP